MFFNTFDRFSACLKIPEDVSKVKSITAKGAKD